MSAALSVAFRLAAVQWLVAWGVVLDAVLARYAPDAPVGVVLLVFAVVGAAFRTAPLRVSGPRSGWIEAGLGAVGLVLLGLALRGARSLADAPAEDAFWWPPWIALAIVLLLDLRAWARLARLVRVEWTKTSRSLLFKVGVPAACVVTLLAGLLHEDLPNQSGWTIAAASLGTGGWVAEVIVLVMGAVALAGEATGGTMKMMLPHAYRRSDWILAKTIVLFAVAAIFVIFISITAKVYADHEAGLGDVTRQLEPMFGEEEGTVETFAAKWVMRPHFHDAQLSLLISLAATALLGLFLSSLFDNVVAALCVAFLLFAGLKFADVVLSLPREALEGIYAWYPGELRELVGKLGRALNERWDEALLPEGARLALLTGSVALLLAIGIFSKRDLQV